MASATYPLSIVVLLVAMACVGVAGAAYLRAVHGWDTVDAYLASAPGGMSQVVVLAAELGADLLADLRDYLPGWKEYFRLAETPKVFAQLDEWIGHRLRAVRLKQWKRGKTAFRELRALGVSSRAAASVAA